MATLLSIFQQYKMRVAKNHFGQISAIWTIVPQRFWIERAHHTAAAHSGNFLLWMVIMADVRYCNTGLHLRWFLDKFLQLWPKCSKDFELSMRTMWRRHIAATENRTTEICRSQGPGVHIFFFCWVLLPM